MLWFTRKSKFNLERLARLDAEAKVDCQEERLINLLKRSSLDWARITELESEVDFYKRLFLLINQEGG